VGCGAFNTCTGGSVISEANGAIDARQAKTLVHGSAGVAAILAVLKTWKTLTQLGGADDWIFASPAQLGRLPWSYPWTWKMFQDAAAAAGLERFGTHTMRHSYRSWLDAVGTTIAVQQKLMRHADIRTTMNVYSTVVTDEIATASGKVARLVVNGTEPSSSH
jgi:integrase